VTGATKKVKSPQSRRNVLRGCKWQQGVYSCYTIIAIMPRLYREPSTISVIMLYRRSSVLVSEGAYIVDSAKPIEMQDAYPYTAVTTITRNRDISATALLLLWKAGAENAVEAIGISKSTK